MSAPVAYGGSALLLVGAVFVLLAALGILRLPDLMTRMHAASKAGVVGGGLILLAVGIVSQDSAVLVRALIGIGFLLLTTPVSAHLLARTTYREKTTRTVLTIDEITPVSTKDSADIGRID